MDESEFRWDTKERYERALAVLVKRMDAYRNTKKWHLRVENDLKAIQRQYEEIMDEYLRFCEEHGK